MLNMFQQQVVFKHIIFSYYKWCLARSIFIHFDEIHPFYFIACISRRTLLLERNELMKTDVNKVGLRRHWGNAELWAICVTGFPGEKWEYAVDCGHVMRLEAKGAREAATVRRPWERETDMLNLAQPSKTKTEAGGTTSSWARRKGKGDSLLCKEKVGAIKEMDQ